MKAFGVDFSKEDLSDVFATCVFCFNHAVYRAASSRQALQLSVIRLRLTRWGEAVKIYEKPLLDYYDADPDDLHDIRKALVDIITLFDTGTPIKNEIVPRLDDMGPETQLLQETLQAIALERSRGGRCLLEPPYFGSSGWSEVQYKLASRSISYLEKLFGSGSLRDLCAEERLQINDEDALCFLEAVAERLDLDPWMAEYVLGKHNSWGDVFMQTVSGAALSSSSNCGIQ